MKDSLWLSLPIIWVSFLNKSHLNHPVLTSLKCIKNFENTFKATVRCPRSDFYYFFTFFSVLSLIPNSSAIVLADSPFSGYSKAIQLDRHRNNNALSFHINFTSACNIKWMYIIKITSMPNISRFENKHNWLSPTDSTVWAEVWAYRVGCYQKAPAYRRLHQEIFQTTWRRSVNPARSWLEFLV